MALHLQEYLRSGKTPEMLQAELAIVFKKHTAHPNLVLFKYDMIDSPMGNPIVQECRGIILDQDDNWNTVARAFDKFFNFGEGHAATLDPTTVRVQEKVDGSLCLLYFYKGEWHVATTGTPDASGEINGSGITFSELFFKTLDKYHVVQNIDMDRRRAEGVVQYCFFFELTSPLNRVVVNHKETSLTLLGARRVSTWEEVHPSTVSHLFPNVPVVKEYPLQTLEEIHETFKTMNPLDQEGYVRVDANFNRDKCKCPSYVALHHAKDGLSASLKNFVEIIRKGESAEWLSAFPELLESMNRIQMKYLELVVSLQEEYIRHANIPVQKDFAMAVVGKSRCSAALFALRAGKVRSIKEYLANCSIDSLMHLLDLK